MQNRASGKVITQKKKSTMMMWATIIVTSIIFTLCSTTSPLYAFCDESHCFFSVGKAIFHGNILYKDILEQKGLLIYLLQIPAYLISRTTFLGVWLIQILLLVLFSVSAFKTLQCCGMDGIQSLVGVAISDAVIFPSQSLASGQIVEVYAIPLFMYSLTSLINEIEKGLPFSLKTIFINGVFAGIILWEKYSLFGFYFAWIIYVCIYLLIKKGFIKSLSAGLVYLGGLLLVTIPCILYFVFNGATSQLCDYYFLNNINGYGNELDVAELIRSYIVTVYYELQWNPLMMIVLLIGMAAIILSKLKTVTKISIFGIAFIHAVVVFSHGPMFPYYLFAFASFVVFGGFGIVCAFSSLLRKISKKKEFAIFSCIAACIFAFVFKPFPREFLADTSTLSQFIYADYMNDKYEHPTLLNYGF